MPLIDMPLEELKRYQGRNPRPADMEEYWARALSEMHALGTGCELVPAAFHAPGVECFDLDFIGAGGARVHGRLARPAGKKNLPAVRQFQGYSGAGASCCSLLS